MSQTNTLTPELRRALLSDLSDLKTDSDDALQNNPKLFLPLDSHKRALRLETLVVRGGRGAGKSALFEFLTKAQSQPKLLNQFKDAAKLTWIDGFSMRQPHPQSNVIEAFAANADEGQRRAFWLAWLCVRIAEVLSLKPALRKIDNDFASNEPAVLSNLGAKHVQDLSRWLDQLNASRESAIVITYDNLDRIGADKQNLIVSLLSVWLNLSDRYQSIRPKIFIREDLFQKSLSAFPDASKFDARSVSIDWQIQDLYRVLIKHMANTSQILKVWIESSVNKVPLTDEGILGWTPPPLEVTGRPSQKAFVDHLAGQFMGTNAKKGFTYTWIPNRLQDAHSRVAPRSMLALIRNAAKKAIDNGSRARNLRLLDPQELQAALEQTSKRRVAEVTEEFTPIARLQNLTGENVLLKRATAVTKLSKHVAGTQGDAFGDDGNAVLAAFIEQGIMSERPDGRIDVPDIYRYAFNIKRSGGVKRVR
jgi:hypothetical protein